jgi:hypothetical protein
MQISEDRIRCRLLLKTCINIHIPYQSRRMFRPAESLRTSSQAVRTVGQRDWSGCLVTRARYQDQIVIQTFPLLCRVLSVSRQFLFSVSSSCWRESAYSKSIVAVADLRTVTSPSSVNLPYGRSILLPQL